MSITVALLVLGSAAVHALWNAILKHRREPQHAVVGVLAISAASAALLAIVRGFALPSTESAAWCVASGVLEVGYFATLARALASAPLGVVYTTVRGGALVIVWPVSVLFLGERAGLRAVIGTAVVVAGLLATGAADKRPRSERDRLGWAILCAAFVGAYHVAYKMALGAGGRPDVVTAISLGTASLITIATLGRDRGSRAWHAARTQPLAIIIAGLLATVGFVVFLEAMGRAGAGAVTTLRNTSILFAQVFGVFLGERPKRLGVIGALLVTGGAVLLAS